MTYVFRKFQRSLSRRMSFKTTAKVTTALARAKIKHRQESLKNEITDLKVNIKMEAVNLFLMTSRLDIAKMIIQDVQASWIQTKRLKKITAKLIDFEVLDTSSGPTLYRKIAKSKDDKVFDAEICLFDHDSHEKSKDLSKVDVSVDLSMGRIELVFLMKFINDVLTFVEPFSGAKELVAEKAENALEGATKTVMDAYASQTRVALNIEMDAPIIIIPISSKNKVTFQADLGNLKLNNDFQERQSRLFDHMHFKLTNLTLNRVKVAEDIESNEIEASCPIIQPIDFRLEVVRNMNQALKKDDPPELKVEGALKQIRLELSRGDYNVLMAILMENFSEKGNFEVSSLKRPPSARPDRTSLNLPLKNRYSSGGSKASLVSNSSIKSLKTTMKIDERDPEARGVEFYFKFRGFQVRIYMILCFTSFFPYFLTCLILNDAITKAEIFLVLSTKVNDSDLDSCPNEERGE